MRVVLASSSAGNVHGLLTVRKLSVYHLGAAATMLLVATVGASFAGRLDADVSASLNGGGMSSGGVTFPLKVVHASLPANAFTPGFIHPGSVFIRIPSATKNGHRVQSNIGSNTGTVSTHQSLTPAPVKSQAPAAPQTSTPSPAPVPKTLANPATNIAPNPDYYTACGSAIQAGEPPNNDECQTAAIAALDSAQQSMGLDPLVIPPDFYSQSPAVQLFDLVNAERVSYGLPAAYGLVSNLNQLALDGSQANGDPPLSQVFSMGPYAIRAGANWAADFSTAATMYNWMYMDGWGGSAADTSNVACTSPTASGCWAHRANLLSQAPAGYIPVMGAASVPESDPSFKGLESDAIVLTFVPSAALSQLSFSYVAS